MTRFRSWLSRRTAPSTDFSASRLCGILVRVAESSATMSSGARLKARGSRAPGARAWGIAMKLDVVLRDAPSYHARRAVAGAAVRDVKMHLPEPDRWSPRSRSRGGKSELHRAVRWLTAR